MLRGIYAISDTTLTPKDKLEQSLQAAIKGGIALFQLRDKVTSGRCIRCSPCRRHHT